MYKDQRKYRRIPTKIRTRFYCNETDYSGIILNISEDGMFISTQEVDFPFESNLELFIRRRHMLLKVPVIVRRLTKSESVFDGMGVQIINPPPEYKKFVRNLKSTESVLK
jgi:hypothetical protein